MGYAQTKIEQIEQLEQLLLAADQYDGISIKELAGHLDCDRTTVHRYLREIEGKQPLIVVKRGHYRLDPSQYISNISLHPTEALSIYLALRRYIRQTTNAPDFMSSALRKVAIALRHPDLITQLSQSSLRMNSERLATPEQAEVWQLLIKAWLEKIVVRIHYTKLWANEATEHEIEPYLFEPAVLSHGSYLIAWSRTRNNLRTFKVHRISKVILTNETFEKQSELDVDDLLRNAWGIYYGQEAKRVELLFSAEVKDRVLETLWHPSQKIEILEDGRVYWTVEIAGLRELWSWIRGWGPDVVVLGPPELRERIVGDLEKTMGLYEE
jgi:predicted DNA-binding transcriptional regulator YafY